MKLEILPRLFYILSIVATLGTVYCIVRRDRSLKDSWDEFYWQGWVNKTRFLWLIFLLAGMAADIYL